MADLISRAAAIDAIVSVTVFPDADYIKNLCENPSNSEDWLGGVCEAINAVEEVNAVDAVPVVHARWRELKDGTEECTNCLGLCPHEENYNGDIIFNFGCEYCPWCGAKMDGERRDSE